MPRNRFKMADEIWNGGASNRKAVARALVEAIDQCYDENNPDCHDPAIQMILDHLAFLIGLPQPALAMSNERWQQIYQAVMDKVPQVPLTPNPA